jgi:DNA-binding XRE family transcriptional regulator
VAPCDNPPIADELTRDTFGAHLRQLRQRQGLTQAVAARHAGVRRETWQQWEYGAIPQIWRAQPIAAALAISLPELLAPNPERVHVADLYTTPNALTRIRQLGAPELERCALELAQLARARIEVAAARATPERAPTPHAATPARASKSAARARIKAAQSAKALAG